MKNTIRKANFLFKRFLNPEDFYCINIWQYEIYAQGKFNQNLIKYLTDHKFKYQLDANASLQFNRSNIQITLTD